MADLEYQEVARAEMHPDVYGGESCDQVIPMWKSYWDGDKDEDHSKEPIELLAEQYPPGTRIVISVPVCPNCRYIPEMCSCGFDWNGWIQDQYS